MPTCDWNRDGVYLALDTSEPLPACDAPASRLLVARNGAETVRRVVCEDLDHRTLAEDELASLDGDYRELLLTSLTPDGWGEVGATDAESIARILGLAAS